MGIFSLVHKRRLLMLVLVPPTSMRDPRVRCLESREFKLRVDNPGISGVQSPLQLRVGEDFPRCQFQFQFLQLNKPPKSSKEKKSKARPECQL